MLTMITERRTISPATLCVAMEAANRRLRVDSFGELSEAEHW
jgi:hypothetical protein